MTGPIRLVLQRTNRDCSVACLASLTGQSYEKTLMAFRHPVYDRGANIRQVREAAKRLGFDSTWTRKIDLNNDMGMLVIGIPDTPRDHLVLLLDGLVIDLEDPATLWEIDDYLEAFKARPLSLITVTHQGGKSATNDTQDISDRQS